MKHFLLISFVICAVFATLTLAQDSTTEASTDTTTASETTAEPATTASTASPTPAPSSPSTGGTAPRRRIIRIINIIRRGGGTQSTGSGTGTKGRRRVVYRVVVRRPAIH